MTDTATKRSPLQAIRLVTWLLVALAAAGFGWLLLSRNSGPPQQVQSGLPGFSLGGPFTLTAANGQPFQSSQLNGKPHAIFFGFTNCPDVCPNTLGRLAQLRKQLGKGDESFEIVFISVDPERDTPQEVGRYAELFDTPITGLTGTPQQIAQVAKQYGIYQAKTPQADAPDGYTVDHSAQVLLFDRAGEFTGTIAQEEQDQVALQKLQRISA